MLKATILRTPAIFRLPLTWWRRARFREQLRADLEGAADFLRDIGISVPDAQAEGARFFWEPVVLTRQPFASIDAALAHRTETVLRSDARQREADIARATHLTSEYA